MLWESSRREEQEKPKKELSLAASEGVVAGERTR